MESQIYPIELQLNKAKSFNTESSFMDVDVSTANGIVSSIIYDKWDDFNFEIVMFAPPPSYGLYLRFITYSFCKGMFLCWWLQQKKPMFDF